jgi:hypothetical protein
MRRSPLQLTLSSAERSQLEHLVRCTTVSSGRAQRAAMVLRFADGQRISRIALELQYTRQVVRMWITRFIHKRLDGLQDLPRSGRPPAFSPGGRHPSGAPGLRAAG